MEKEPNAGPGPSEYFESRAKEYRERYESMRTLEWQTLLQTYAGYAAIGVAFQKADDRFHDAWVFRCIAVGATLVFTAAMHYLHYRIEERLITFNENHRYYVNELRWQSFRGQWEDKCPGTSNLGHRYFWTYATQMLVGTLTATAMLAYESFPATPVHGDAGWWPQSAVVIFTLLVALLMWIVERKRLGRLLTQLSAQASAAGHLMTPDHAPSGERNLVWYASYGSNLAHQRFLCYIHGGTPAGSGKSNPGCRDKTPPLDIRPIILNFELFFAGHSKPWGGAVAFIRHGQADAKTLGRMYLITAGQFNDVVLQENNRKVDGSRLIPSLEELAREKEHVLPGVNGYGRLLVAGNEGTHPIVTFTSTETGDLSAGPPGEPYVKIIAAGLKETYPLMEDREIVEYLLRAEGIRGWIPTDQLAEWVAES